MSPFAERTDRETVETGKQLAPKFDEKGLIVCITTDATSGELLMVGYMNAEALAMTIETGKATYWSRSRNELWIKGATSGQVQHVVEMRTDCDQDAIWLQVQPGGNGGACHVGYRSCFFRKIPTGSAPGPDLEMQETDVPHIPHETR